MFYRRLYNRLLVGKQLSTTFQYHKLNPIRRRTSRSRSHWLLAFSPWNLILRQERTCDENSERSPIACPASKAFFQHFVKKLSLHKHYWKVWSNFAANIQWTNIGKVAQKIPAKKRSAMCVKTCSSSLIAQMLTVQLLLIVRFRTNGHRPSSLAPGHQPGDKNNI